MKSTVSKPLTKFGNEASRRLYRGAADAARKLEQKLGLASSLTELFSSEVTDLRMRLKDYCERLIFTDPVEYGKKAEDLLWRKVFYDFFFRCKQNRKKLLDSEVHRSALISHLLAGIGFYHHLLLRIQTEFHINLEGKINAPLLWHLKGVKKERWKKYQQSAASDDSVKNWAEQASHRILIYLGDLERYMAELNEIESNHLAERYYQQAFCINNQNGTPHNQLGSLYNNRFDSAYHYMRCLACIAKFDGAEGNLMRVFEKNEDVIEQLYSPECIDEESLKCSRFLSRFLKLCQMFYFKPSDNYGSEIYCQDILKEFEITLNSKSPGQESTSTDVFAQLTDDIIFKVVAMSLMCVHKLQEKGHTDASVATAFCLALFSYVVDKATSQLINALLEYKKNLKHSEKGKEDCFPMHVNKNKGSLSDISLENENVKDTHLKKTSVKKVGLKKFSARRLRTFRRRRKISSTSQEDSELSDGEMMELQESDEEVLSDVSQTGSCSSETASENEEELPEENGYCSNGNKELNMENPYALANGCLEHKGASEMKNLSLVNGQCDHSPIAIDNILENLVSTDKIIEILKSTSLLSSLKVFSDWLKINEDILSACAESSQLLLSRLLEFLNILLKFENKLQACKEYANEMPYNFESWKQLHPLPEDINLWGFPLLKEVHSSLSFEVLKRRELSLSLQIYLRMQCLLQFGKSLIKVSDSLVDFDSDKNRYFFNLCNKKKESNKEEVAVPKAVNSSTENQKHNLMKSMAHLWLKAEVNDLETLVECGSAPQLSPYLVSDTNVLCSNLPVIKQLVSAKRFIIVVPLVVIASLDQLKKESLGAREAIRWLESELQKGCRYIRAQRQMEKISLVPMKYPKKKEREAWDFFQILECCNYLVQQQTNGCKTDCSLVTLLVSSQHYLPENAIVLAQSIDVTVEKLSSFISKWRSSMKNPG